MTARSNASQTIGTELMCISSPIPHQMGSKHPSIRVISHISAPLFSLLIQFLYLDLNVGLQMLKQKPWNESMIFRAPKSLYDPIIPSLETFKSHLDMLVGTLPEWGLNQSTSRGPCQPHPMHESVIRTQKPPCCFPSFSQ